MAVSEGALEIDLYGGSFVRVRPSITLPTGEDHWLKPALATTPGPGGAVIPDLAALRGYGHTATWYDKGGSLGKMTTASGNDVWPSDLATWIDHGQVMRVHDEVPGADGHPHLVYIASEAESQPPVEDPGSVHDIYAQPDALAAVTGLQASDARLSAALLMASRWVDYVMTGEADLTPVDDPIATRYVPQPIGIRQATLVAAARFLRSADVPFGVAGGLGDLAVYVKSDIPEAEMHLVGHRTSWGIA
jgi:hypothetical protein